MTFHLISIGAVVIDKFKGKQGMLNPTQHSVDLDEIEREVTEIRSNIVASSSQQIYRIFNEFTDQSS